MLRKFAPVGLRLPPHLAGAIPPYPGGQVGEGASLLLMPGGYYKGHRKIATWNWA